MSALLPMCMYKSPGRLRESQSAQRRSPTCNTAIDRTDNATNEASQSIQQRNAHHTWMHEEDLLASESYSKNNFGKTRPKHARSLSSNTKTISKASVQSKGLSPKRKNEITTSTATTKSKRRVLHEQNSSKAAAEAVHAVSPRHNKKDNYTPVKKIAEKIVATRHSELPDINEVVPSTLRWGMTSEELDSLSESLFRPNTAPSLSLFIDTGKPTKAAKRHQHVIDKSKNIKIRTRRVRRKSETPQVLRVCCIADDQPTLEAALGSNLRYEIKLPDAGLTRVSSSYPNPLKKERNSRRDAKKRHLTKKSRRRQTYGPYDDGHRPSFARTGSLSDSVLEIPLHVHELIHADKDEEVVQMARCARNRRPTLAPMARVDSKNHKHVYRGVTTHRKKI